MIESIRSTKVSEEWPWRSQTQECSNGKRSATSVYISSPTIIEGGREDCESEKTESEGPSSPARGYAECVKNGMETTCAKMGVPSLKDGR